MLIAYADPPYPGRSTRLYKDHPDFAGEVDHRELLDTLDQYDGFALHTSTTSLAELLPLCPKGHRVLAWVKPWASWKPGRSPAFAWEPIIIAGHRRRSDADKARDYFAHHPTTRRGFKGAKPEPVIEWVFACLGLEADDELVDLYPGTGAVTKTWERYRAQMRIDIAAVAAQERIPDAC